MKTEGHGSLNAFGRIRHLGTPQVRELSALSALRCLQLIEQNWDDMLRVAGSLKLGTVSATEIVRALQRGKKPSTIAKAIGELGKITKTLYLLNYVDDEAYRRRILTQLNRGESRHSLTRATFYGRRGEIRQRYREGQEEQLGTLGLVTNVLVLWNTYYMDALSGTLSGSIAIDLRTAT